MLLNEIVGSVRIAFVTSGNQQVKIKISSMIKPCFAIFAPLGFIVKLTGCLYELN